MMKDLLGDVRIQHPKTLDDGKIYLIWKAALKEYRNNCNYNLIIMRYIKVYLVLEAKIIGWHASNYIYGNGTKV